MTKKLNNVTPIMSKVSDEDKAYDFMMMHYNRVVTMDEVNDKAITRAGKMGVAIRELLGSIQLFARVRNGAKVMRIDDVPSKQTR